MFMKHFYEKLYQSYSYFNGILDIIILFLLVVVYFGSF